MAIGPFVIKSMAINLFTSRSIVIDPYEANFAFVYC